MSVESEMELGPILDAADVASWPSWVAVQPVLATVPDPLRMREWVQGLDPVEADEVLYALAWLASVEGGNDEAAARVLAWLLVPGAAFMARTLRTLSRDIDHMVAAELWLLVRTFRVKRRKLFSNLMWDLRSNVLAACEAAATVRRCDPTWFATTVAGIDAEIFNLLASEPEPSAADELAGVLEWAVDREVIAPADHQLLLLLIDASHDVPARRASGHGLLQNEVTDVVAAHLGVSDRTVRRHARRSILALTEASRHYTRVI